ncbi:peptidylprolyl isomerase [Roseivirga misakiensis]|uniref:PpiC domain-containing protein n=1 Tax=Roseivirga misakiensis TaxID=1563681 RepID=A0A1E5T5V3_9BACT|nr:peptidylprolyl isomerase [Roseivirga misakiensis]OEK06740.1 hypothetical protein BFP71_03505 [Roseivirga misakiensis]
MRVFCSFLLCLISISQTLGFQSKDVVLATVNQVEISSGELLYAFEKTNSSGENLSYDSLSAYLNRYIDFKLKVLEARRQGYDTLAALKTELQGYVSQIPKPYLVSKVDEDSLVNEIYKRMHTEIDASHILIPLAPEATPEDTLKAYMLIDSLRVAADSKNTFEELARQYSKDGSALQGGNLGWFTAMDMVGPFEDVAYSTPVDQVSTIAKTRFGYHIIYVNRKRKSKGKLKTSHIFFNNKIQNDDEAKKSAASIYDSLKNGADWNTMARLYSQDNNTKMKGGELPLARIKQLPDDFMDIAYSLDKIGDFSAPQKTSFGWHIVKLDGQQEIPPLSLIKSEITRVIEKSGKKSLDHETLFKKLKNENRYQKAEQTYNELVNALSNKNLEKIQKLGSETLFTIGAKNVLAQGFINFLPSRNIALDPIVLESFYQDYEEQVIIGYEDSIATQKYPEYGFLLKEYEEGLLLFEIMQNEVWNKAITDSIQNRNFYESNIQNYAVGVRLHVQAVSGLDEKSLDQLIKIQKKSKNKSDLKQIADEHLGRSKRSLLKIVKRTIKVSEIPNFEPVGVKSGSWVYNSATGEHYLVEEFIPAGTYKFEEIKGLVISDYQDYLDEQWIQSLRERADIKIYKKALKSISTN